MKIFLVAKHKLLITVHTRAQWVQPVWPAESAFSILTLLTRALRATPSYQKIKRDSLCVFVCLNSFETARRTDIKLGTIDHHQELSLLRGLVTSPLRHKRYFLICIFEPRNAVLTETKASTRLTNFNKFRFFGVSHDVIIAI